MSRDLFSKTREKWSRSSSGESTDSFVKNVTARVSGYLPATITKWFSSPRATGNGSAPAADAVDSSSEDETPDIQPPAKRMRYSSGTDANCVTNNIETIETSTPFTVQSPPAQSMFRRETNFVSTPIRSPEETTMERTEKDSTFFPQHTVSITGPSIARKRKSLFGNQSEEISEASKKACVKSSNNTVKDPRQPTFKPTLLGSPFYAGRTTYGGAASSYINQPNITQRQNTVVRESSNKTDNNISHSAKRVLELLESYSSPLTEAKRIPQYSRPTKEQLRKRISESALSSSPYTRVNSYKTQELHVPQIATILRLRHRSRLDDTTNAARQLIASHSSSSPDYLRPPYGTKSDRTETDSSKTTTKVKSRLTRPARGEASSLDTDTVTPPDLPKAVLKIDPSNLPNFTFTPKSSASSTDKPQPNKPLETISKPDTSHRNSIYNFANPVSITSESPKPQSTPPKFSFVSPERSIETARKEPEPKPLVPMETEKPAFASKAKCTLCKLADSQADSDKCVNCAKVQVNNIAKPLKADTSKFKCKDCWVENDEAAGKCASCGASNVKQAEPLKVDTSKWKCNDCWVQNDETAGKCACCGASNLKQAEPLKVVVDTSKWQCKVCFVGNDEAADKCACCGASNVKQAEPLKVDTSKWKCNDCWVQNDEAADKCACCGASNLKQAEPLKVVVDTSKWKCKVCFVGNDEAAGKCVCCGASNPKQASQTVPAKKPDAPTCSKCSTALTLGKCNNCAAPTIKPDSTLQAIIKAQAEKWECIHCLTRNDSNRSKCACCQSQRAHQTNSGEMYDYNFGAGINKFKFGIDANAQEAKPTAPPVETKDKPEESETNNNVLPKAPPTFSFGIPAKKPDSETDTPSENAKETPKPTFSFGIPKQNSVAPAPASIFGIANNTSEAPKTDAKVQDKPDEAKKPEDALKPPVVTFGVPPTTSTPGVTFGVPPTTSTPVVTFGVPPATSTPVVTFGVPPTTSTPVVTFGVPPTTSTPVSLPAAAPAFSQQKEAPSNPVSLPTSVAAAPTLTFSAPKSDASSPFANAALNFTPITTASGGLFQKADGSKPLSIFNNSEVAASAPAPASLFQKTEPAAPAPLFSFGSAPAAQRQSDQPKFNFTFKSGNPTFGAPTESNTNKFTLGTDPLAAANPLATGVTANSVPVNSMGASNPTNSLPTPGLFGSAQKENMWSASNNAANPFNAGVPSGASKPFSFTATASPAFNAAAPAFGASTGGFGGGQAAPSIFGMAGQGAQPMFAGGQPSPFAAAPLGVFARPPATPAPSFSAPAANFEQAAAAPAPAFNFTSQPTGVFGFGQQQQQSALGGAPAAPYSFAGAGAGAAQTPAGQQAARRMRRGIRRNMPPR